MMKPLDLSLLSGFMHFPQIHKTDIFSAQRCQYGEVMSYGRGESNVLVDEGVD